MTVARLPRILAVLGSLSAILAAPESHAQPFIQLAYEQLQCSYTPCIQPGDTAAAYMEGNTGTKRGTWRVQLSQFLPNDVTFRVRTANGTALAGEDYQSRNSILTIPAGALYVEWQITSFGDTTVEPNEQFSFFVEEVTGAQLWCHSAGAFVTSCQQRIVLKNDDVEAPPPPPANPPRPLSINDTGAVSCFGNTTPTGTVSAATPDPEAAGYDRQDCTIGRTAADALGRLQKSGGSSVLGRDYTKIANNGAELPSSANLGTAPTDWGCTRDNLTGLYWEVKRVQPSNLRYVDHLYNWVNCPLCATSCNSTLASCDVVSFVSAVNAAGMCGFTNWRVPTWIELRTLLAWEKSNVPYIDEVYFPGSTSLGTGAAAGGYWTSDIFAFNTGFRWYVPFRRTVGGETAGNTIRMGVRLVRTAP